MTVYHPDPARGCGKKKPGGFYLEAEFADRAGGGILNAWTWMLGESVEGGVNCAINIPPRRMVLGNIAATLTMGEYISLDVPLNTDSVSGIQEVYGSLIAQVGDEAIFDHVGTVHYSAMQFVNEVEAYGPSRRVPRQIAEKVVNRLPVLIVFTHNRVPLFRSQQQRDTAVSLVGEIDGSTRLEDVYTGANWLREDWGVFASQANGQDHYMVPILAIVDRLERRPDSCNGKPLYEEAKALFADVPFAEQVIGASWITRVGYVPQGEGDDVTAVTSKGIQIIDVNTQPEQAE